MPDVLDVKKCKRIELLAGGPKVAGPKSFQICSTHNSGLQLPPCGHFKGSKIHLLPLFCPFIIMDESIRHAMNDIATFLTEG